MPLHTTITWLRREIFDAMREQALDASPMETGGVLIGYWSDDAAQAVITDATDAGPKAFHGRHEFIPDDEYQDRRIAEIYDQSGRRHRYLGDWHTHPFGGGDLSFRDRRTLVRLARHPSTERMGALMAIVAFTHQTSDLHIWRQPAPIGRVARVWPSVAEKVTLRLYSE